MDFEGALIPSSIISRWFIQAFFLFTVMVLSFWSHAQLIVPLFWFLVAFFNHLLNMQGVSFSIKTSCLSEVAFFPTWSWKTFCKLPRVAPWWNVVVFNFEEHLPQQVLHLKAMNSKRHNVCQSRTIWKGSSSSFSFSLGCHQSRYLIVIT